MRIAIFEHAVTRVKGGMEKVVCDIANSMAKRGHDVLIFADNNNSNAGLIYNHDPQINVANIDFAEGDVKGEMLQWLEDFRAEVFLIIYSSNNYLNPLYDVVKFCPIPVVFSEHSNPVYIHDTPNSMTFRHAVLSMGDFIHILLDEFKNSLHPVNKTRAVVIGNPIEPSFKLPSEHLKGGVKKLLYVGRLNNYPKQIDMLVDAFSLLAPEFPEWILELWGHGPHEQMISQQIKDRGLEGRAFLRGKSDSIYNVYASAHLLCLPSFFEGFGLAAAEAHSCGIPVVAFADCSGVNSIVINEKNGLLVKKMTVQSLASALERLMRDDELRERLGKGGMETAKRFSPKVIFDQWEQLLERAAALQNGGIREFDPSIISKKSFDKIRSEIHFQAYPGRYDPLPQINVLTGCLESENKLNAMLSSQINAIYTSRSWRITAPLRAIIKQLRGY